MALAPIISVTSLIPLLIMVEIIRANPLPQNSQGNPSRNRPAGQANTGKDVGRNGPPGQVYIGQDPGWNGPPGQIYVGQGLGWNGQGQGPDWNGQGQGPGWNGQDQRPGWIGQGQGLGWSGPFGQVNSGPGSYYNPPSAYNYQNPYPNGVNYLYPLPNPNGMNQIQPTNWNYGYNPNDNIAGLSQFPSGNGMMNNFPPGGPLNDWRNNYGSVSGSYPNQNVNQRSLDIKENTTPKGKQ
ncbi:uncharacterized protein [Anabrus simplex]|uniref:uncharacterized protein n=1 Tax=Anabrus simplex TaxID=316456 RepID=UPI0035A39396